MAIARRALFLFALCFPFLVHAQGTSEFKPGATNNNNSADKYIKMEEQVKAGLPELLKDLQDMGAMIRKGQVEETQAKLSELRDDLKMANQALSKEAPFQEVQNTFDKMSGSLDKAENALAKGDRKTANIQISQAYRYAKVLATSPALKLSTAMALVDGASKQIQKKNYGMAGNFLNGAIGILNQVESNPKIDSRDVNSLKNEMVIVHQQVVLGKLADEKPVNAIYSKMAIANSNTLYQYYDMWSRTDVPWDNY